MNEQALFIAALQQDRDRRAAYLDKACGDDPALRERVEVLLAAHEKAGSFMQQPAAGGITEAYRPISEGPGTVIGPYKLLQQIGEGGFGVVYMAEQTEPVRRKVALKIIKPGMDTKEVIARFESERQALALMDHPNVARVLHAGATDTGRPYFVMELVRGVPITEFCDKNHLPTAGRLDLFRAVCLAVQHAHQKGIIHRDIKPSNILVTLHDGQPVPKVIDFGIAKATSQRLTERTLFTAYGQMVGTPAYMSPEQAEMSGLDIDTRSDIYSLGVLLYELLTGTTPLETKRLREAGYAEMQRLIREEEPPRPSTRLSSLGGDATMLAGHRGTDVKRLTQLLRGDLDWIVMKALEKDRNRRYETPSAFAADVERFLHNEPIIARPPSVVYRLQKFARRNRAAVATAAIVLVLLVLGTTGTTVGMVWALRAEGEANHDAQRARDAEQLAGQRLQDVKQERDAATEARAQLQSTYAREDSRRLAAESQVARADNPGLALLLAIAGANRAPTRYAPHNNALLAALRDCREERTFLAPPFQTPEGRTGRTSFHAVHVTPDGSRAVVAGERFNEPGPLGYVARDNSGSAWVYDLVTGKVTATMRLPGTTFRVMAVSPDGKLLAAVPNQTVIVYYSDEQFIAYTERAIRIWEIATGKEIRVLTGHTDNVVSLAFDGKGERLLSASWDKTARIWDMATGKSLHVLAGSGASLRLADFSPDGRRVITVPSGDIRMGTDVARWAGNRTGQGLAFPANKTRIDPPLRTDATVRWVDTIRSASTSGGRGIRVPILWDAATGKQLAALEPARPNPQHPPSTRYTAGFSPDSQRVVTVRSDRIFIWNAEDGTPIREQPIAADAFDHTVMDGERRLRVVRPSMLAWGVSIWQTAKDPQAWQHAPSAVRSTFTDGVAGQDGAGSTRLLDTARAGPPLIAWANGDTVSIRTLADGNEVATLRGHDDKVSSAAFLPGSKRVVTAAIDGTLRLWNLEGAHRPILAFKRTSLPQVGYAVFARDGTHVIGTAARDKSGHFEDTSVSVWDAGTGKLVSTPANDTALATTALHGALVGSLLDLDVSPDGERLVTVHGDYNPWPNRPTGAPATQHDPPPHPLFTPVRIWDLRTGKRLAALPGFRRSVLSARFSPDGRHILTLADGKLNFADVRDGKYLGRGTLPFIEAVRLDVWDAATARHLRAVIPEQTRGRPSFALWSPPDGQRILTDTFAEGHKTAAHILSAATGERLVALKHGVGPIDHAAFSPDGKRVLGYRTRYVGDRTVVEIWDAATGAIRCTLRGHTGDVTSAEFSPDSRLILTTSTDRTARLWDAVTGQERHLLRGHRNSVNAGRCSPDGKWAATASVDGTARIWSTATGQEWMLLPVAGRDVYGVDFSPDSARILTTSADGTVRIWPVDPLPLATARAPRALTADERARYQIAPQP